MDWLRIEGGREIAARVPAGDLVVASDFSTLPPTDPRLLFRADREGWPMRAREITRDRLEKLLPFGARWVAVLTDPEHPEVAAPEFLAPLIAAEVPVAHEGRMLGTLHLYDLRRGLDGAPSGRP